MALDEVVLCADGLRVAQRGARRPTEGPALWVTPVRPVAPGTGVPVEARRLDGVVWRRHWLQPERLVLEFVGLAVVEVNEATGAVTFDRRLDDDMEQHLLFDHVLPLVLARKGRVVVHGGLVSRDGRGVIVIGASGAGKSTFTAFSWLRGWTVGGDDGSVVSPGPSPAAEPTYATIRLRQDSAALLDLDLSGSAPVAGKFRVGGTHVAGFLQERVALRLIVMLERAAPDEAPSVTPLDSLEAHARLFGSTFHAELTGHRLLPPVIDALASIVEATPVVRLSLPPGREGLVGAEALLRHLVEEGAGAPHVRRVANGADG